MRFAIVAVAVTVAACGPPVDRSGPWLPAPDKRAERYQDALEQAQSEQGLPGLAMAIADHDRHELWVGAVGMANLDTQDPWTDVHRSRIGSVTKTLTSAVVYQLVEEGALSLDDPIEDWVQGKWTGVTVRDLLGHSSGIVSYNYVGNFDTSRPWTPDELVQWAWDAEPELRFTPGSRWEYSNTNFVLLGLIIEAETGRSYETELQDRLFTPLELTSMRLSGTGETLSDDLVRCYSASPHEDISDVDPSFGWAAGSLVSTPGDLARWNDALFFGDVLTPDSRSLMITPQGLTADDETPYGLGAFYESDGEYTNYGHTGGIAGYLTYAYTLEDPAVSLVVMSNQLDTDMRDASTHGWAAILNLRNP